GGAGGRGATRGTTETLRQRAAGRQPARFNGKPASGNYPAGDEARRAEMKRNAADSYAFRQTTGREAIDQSRRLQQLKEQAVDELEVESLREVEGRQFQWQRGTWQDATATDKLAVTTGKVRPD